MRKAREFSKAIRFLLIFVLVSAGWPAPARAGEDSGGEPPEEAVTVSDAVYMQMNMASSSIMKVGIAAGGYHSLVLLEDGTVFATGRNREAIYNDWTGQATVPEDLQGHVAAVSAGHYHSVVLLEDGTVRAWGDNKENQTDVPDGLTDVIAIDAGPYHTLALRADGTVAAWGSNIGYFINSQTNQSVVPPGLSDVVAVAAGGLHSVALKRDGSIVCWGSNEFGQCNVPSDLTGVIAISAGYYHTLALKNDGTVAAWGAYHPLNNFFDRGQTQVPTDLTDVRFIAAGDFFSLAMKADGTIYFWGDDDEGALTLPADLEDVVWLDAGYGHVLALHSDGSVISWGSNDYGERNIPAELRAPVPVFDDAALVQAVLEELESGSLALGDLSEVTRNLTLPQVYFIGTLGVGISWTSDRPEIISSTGIVRRPFKEEGDQIVTLTRTVRRGGVSVTDIFLATVVKLPDSIFDGGEGTEEEPYKIRSADHLDIVRRFPDKHYIQVANIDMAIEGYSNWEPIGEAGAPFTGTYDGNGYVIRNLKIRQPEGSNVGLFGVIENAVIANVHLENAAVVGKSKTGGLAGESIGSTIAGSSVSGSVKNPDPGKGEQLGGLVGSSDSTVIEHSFSTADVEGHGLSSVGGLVGVNFNHSSIINSYASGKVTGSASYSGGLVGNNWESSSIEGSFATGDVNVSGEWIGGLAGANWHSSIVGSYATGNVTGNEAVGGLVGWNGYTDTGGVIEKSYATGNVLSLGDYAGGLVGDNQGTILQSFSRGHVEGGDYVGGLVGANWGWDGDAIIENSYAAGDVTGQSYVGGLAGWHGYIYTDDLVSNSYSTGHVDETASYSGGLIGWNSLGFVENSYYNTETSGMGDTDNGTPLTTEKMRQKLNFQEWDFITVWDIEEGAGYPFLRWEGEQAAFAVTYDLNGGFGMEPTEEGKRPGQTFTAAGANGLTAPPGKEFAEWNTKADGTGTSYPPGSTVIMPIGDLTLYAIWKWHDLYFGEYEGSPILWRVLSLNAEEMFLLSEEILDERPFASANGNYGVSGVREWLNGDFLTSFTGQEQSAIRPQKVADEFGGTVEAVYDPAGDLVFLLSRKEAESSVYFPRGYADRAKGDDWLLRSMGTLAGSAAFITETGEIDLWGSVSDEGVRPALKLNPMAVLHRSDANEGVPTADGTLQPYAEPVAGPVKLTLKDPNQTLTVDRVTAKSLTAGSEVTIEYSGAGTGGGSHLAVKLEIGASQYFGAVKELAPGGEQGTATFTLPEELTPDSYTLTIWNERFQPAGLTNYAGTPATAEVKILYSVTYNVNGGQGAAPTESDKTEGETFALAGSGSFTAPLGQRFKEWNTKADGTGTGYQAGAQISMPAGDLTLYAIWENIPLVWKGAGTSGNPYQVESADHLFRIRDKMLENATVHFIQTEDIDLVSYAGWIPIGDENTPFTGRYNGNGKVITGLSIDDNALDYTGFFGYVGSGGMIENVKLDGAQVRSAKAGAAVGGLAGFNGGTIVGSSVSGNITGPDSGHAGGLAGINEGSISESYSHAAVTGGDNAHAGGLAGINEGTISESYSHAAVTGGDNAHAGGLAALNQGLIADSYSSGAVTGGSGSAAGGLIALNDGGEVESSYYLDSAAGASDGGVPKAEDELKRKDTFAGWDFVSVWKIGEDASYPTLRWQPWSADEAITEDLNALTWDIIRGTNTDEDKVTANLHLPTAGAQGSAIAWSVQPDDGWINTTSGAVTRPGQAQGNQTVDLMATVSKAGGASRSVTFQLTILAQEPADSGSGNGSDSAPPQQPTQPAQTVEPDGTIHVTPELNEESGVAAAEIDETAINAALEQVAEAAGDGTKTVEIVLLETEGASAYEVTLPAGAVSANDENLQIEVVTSIGTVTLPANMLTGETAENADKVTVTVARADAADVEDEAIRGSIGGRPVIQVDVQVDGEPYTGSAEGKKMKISIPYEPKEEELADPEHIAVRWITEDGKTMVVSSGKYDPATGMVTFTVAQPGRYAVDYVTKTFADLDSVPWAKKAVEVLASKGVLRGVTDQEYAPRAFITRADFLYFLVKALNLDAQADENFADIGADAYYAREIAIARKLGITSGTGGNRFDPNAPITRQDMMTLTVRALRMLAKLQTEGGQGELDKFADKSAIAPYAVDSVATLVKEGLIVGDGGRLDPAGNATRAQAAVFLYKIYKQY